MSRILLDEQSRITHDERSGAIRTWYNADFVPDSKDSRDAAQLARQVLGDSADLFGWHAQLPDVLDRAVQAAPSGESVRFIQEYRGIPVDSSDIVVNLASTGRLYSIYNGYHYDIPDSLPEEPSLSEQRAAELAQRLLAGHKERELISQQLVVYRYQRTTNSTGKPSNGPSTRMRVLSAAMLLHAEAAEAGFVPEPGAHYLAWDIRVRTFDPVSSWRVLIDASSGHLLNLIDLAQYATGTAEVFDPNPIVTSGDTALRHNSTAATINAQRVSVTVPRLAAAVGGNLKLTGDYVQMAEKQAPVVAGPANAGGDFNFNWDDNSFLDAMAYYHLDRFQDYIQSSLGLTNVANYSIMVDPQAENGDDNSHYHPTSTPQGQGFITFGGGIQPIPSSNPVPDAADAMVVLHEYGHAIQDNSNPGFDNPSSGVGEGWGDTLAAIYYDDKHATPTATRGVMMSWDSEMGAGSWMGRRYDRTWLFDGPEYAAAVASDNHTAGELWASTMLELYRKLGGDSAYPGTKAAARDLALRLHLMANFHVPTHAATAQQMGTEIEAADHNLAGWRYANGLHRKVIYDTFRRRHLAGHPDLAVDVYINDGRRGGYGSVSTNDAFNEKLWLDTWWETQDLWVTVTPYPDAASQQAGDPGDHVEPPVGRVAYLYVRVKNRGTDATGSGPVTVKAFHADPTIGLTWPDNWLPMNTASLPVANVLPGPASAVVVGPFPWTPSVVGHECVLAVVECARDRAISQDLAASDHIPDGGMVPFDNNIAQRNLVPTSAKVGGTGKFVVRNPFEEPKLMRLDVVDNLPEGWRWRLPGEGRVELAGGESRWIEIAIDRVAGAEVTEFTEPHQVQVTGVIDGQPIGGMTFYLAPPSAFPAGGPTGDTRPGHRHRSHEQDDLVSLNIPWRECAIEGEIDIHLRFRRD